MRCLALGGYGPGGCMVFRRKLALVLVRPIR